MIQEMTIIQDFKCKLNLIVNPLQDIEVEGTYNGFGMEIYLNNVRVETESANVTGTAKGYTTGSIKNKITIQLSFGDGNIGSVTINGTNMTFPDGTQDRAEFEVEPASKYTIVVTKSQNTTNALKIENPQTYDGIVEWIILGLVSMGGIVGTIVYRKKKIYN